MKNMNLRPGRVLFLVLAIAVGFLALPKLMNTNVSRAQTGNQGMSSSFYYTEPTTQLNGMKLDSSSTMDITESNIHVSGADIWQGAHPRYIIALHYTDSNNDGAERRFVFVVRSIIGIPWIIADSPVEDPNGVPDGSKQTNRTIWFVFDVNKTALQSNPRIPASWFAEVATSTIEVGITDRRRFNIAGPGDLPEDEEISLLPLTKIEDILIFAP